MRLTKMRTSGVTPEEYMKKPYSRVIIPDEATGTYTARILEFPGCIAEGKTVRQAYDRLEKAAVSWIQAALDLGQDIPLPALQMAKSKGRSLISRSRLPSTMT